MTYKLFGKAQPPGRKNGTKLNWEIFENYNIFRNIKKLEKIIKMFSVFLIRF